MPGEKKNADCHGEDRVVIGPALADGSHGYVRHTAEHEIELGSLHRHPDGKPLGPDDYHLEPRGGSEYALKPVLDDQKGPVKVTTEAYRENWETIFGKRVPVGKA